MTKETTINVESKQLHIHDWTTNPAGVNTIGLDAVVGLSVSDCDKVCVVTMDGVRHPIVVFRLSLFTDDFKDFLKGNDRLHFNLTADNRGEYLWVTI